ncbi:MAG: hypothetical protein M3545_14190, partial [Acidobacteriota bacterium]|nr:hypothetical protein [Acidobacteriota bacterium]
IPVVVALAVIGLVDFLDRAVCPVFRAIYLLTRHIVPGIPGQPTKAQVYPCRAGYPPAIWRERR